MTTYSSSDQDATSGAETSASNVRIQRGARAIGADGELGRVQQIVVNQQTGELRGIVIKRSADGAEFELPVDVVLHTTGDEIRLDLAQADLDARPDLAHPYNPEQYVAVQPGDTTPHVQATRTARDTEHPVVTTIEQDAATLITPPSTPRSTSTRGRSDTAIPSSNQPVRDAQNTAEDNTDTTPRHDPSRADIGEETLTPAPPTEESTAPEATGDLVGGKPSSSGMGDASTPITAHSSSAPTQRPPDTSTASTSPTPNDLADLSDDELSNPDTALINARPGTEERVTRPYNNPTSSPDSTTSTTTTSRTEQERAGMRSAFSTATNTSADDTYTVREPAVTAPLKSRQSPMSESDPPHLEFAPEVPNTSHLNDPANETPQDAWRPSEVPSARPSATSHVANAYTAPLQANPPARTTSQQPTTTRTAEQQRWVAENLLPRAPLAGGIALLAGGIALLGTVGGLTARLVASRRKRQATLSAKAKQAASTATSSLATNATDALSKVQDFADQVLKPAAQRTLTAATDSATQTRRSIRKSAKRGKRRMRWFTRGALVGAGLAILFAPMPGVRLRAQLQSTYERLRSRTR